MLFKKINIRHVFLVSGVLSLVISYTFLWIRMITNPVERTGSDFIAFYTAGTIATQDGARYVYDPLYQQDVQQEQVGFELIRGQVLLYNHVPYLIPLLRLIVTPNYVASFIRWLLVLLIIYLSGISLLVFFLKQEWKLNFPSVIMGLCLLTFFPLFISILNGQDTGFIFLGIVLWIYGLFRKKDWLAGFGLALSTIRPHIAILLAFPYLFQRNKVFLSFIVNSFVLVIISSLLIGLGGMQNFIDILLISASGEWFGIKESEMVNLLGILIRLFPAFDKDAFRFLGWIIYGLALVGLCIFMNRRFMKQEHYTGITVLVALVAVPHLHYHDLTLLIFPVISALMLSVSNRVIKSENAPLLILGISLVFMMGFISVNVQYNLPAILMGLLAVVLIWPGVMRFKRKAANLPG